MSFYRPKSTGAAVRQAVAPLGSYFRPGMLADMLRRAGQMHGRKHKATKGTPAHMMHGRHLSRHLIGFHDPYGRVGKPRGGGK